MNTRNYWLDLFTGTTWKEFLGAGAGVSGFRESKWRTVQRLKPGDYLLCYVTGISRFIGVLEVTSDAFKDATPIWKDATFPCRVSVKPIVTLEFETAVPVFQLKEKLSVFRNLANPRAWTGHFRGSPHRWSEIDGQTVVAAVLEAKENPVVHPVDPKKIALKPKGVFATKKGPVTVPESEEQEDAAQVPLREPSQHVEMQWLLLKLGSDMGLDVWVARNDRGREWGGYALADLPRMRKELPNQFDTVTSRTIELIDVLWLKGNAVVAAFEIESTTSIYSGLLRMADLVTMQPNLNIPLYVVAPDDRREKVITEINRPTFFHLSVPLNRICRFIPFSALRERLKEVATVIAYLKPDFIEELSESCEIEED